MTSTHSLHAPMASAPTHIRSIVPRRIAFAALLSALACSSTADPPEGNGGTTSSGGAQSLGGSMANTGAVVGSGGASASGGGVAVMVPACVTAAFTSATLCGACHASNTAAIFGGLDLSGDVLSRILDKPATYNLVEDRANCKPGALLLDTANPENSVMLKKLLGTQDCGATMPLSFSISEAEKACLVDWIRSL